MLRASASAARAAISPAIQYERKRTDETGTPLTNAERSLPRRVQVRPVARGPQKVPQQQHDDHHPQHHRQTKGLV